MERKKYDYVDWFCDSCDANLNRQLGFTTASGTWICTECGAVNDVTDNNILDEDEEIYQEEYPNCGGHMRRMTYSPFLYSEQVTSIICLKASV